MNLRFFFTCALVSPVSIAVYLRTGPLEPLTRPEYSPRRDFYLAHPFLMWTNLGNSLLVAASYALFIAGILWLVRKLKHLPQLRQSLWILSTLNIFFSARLAVTVLSIVNLWWPLYNFTLALNFVAAVASAPVAAAFIWSAPALAANIARFFQLHETEQQYADALRKSEAFLDRTNRIAGIGGWEVDLLTGRVTWSAETYRIHGLPLDVTPTLAAGIDFYAEEARPVILAAVERAMQTGESWDLELPVNRADGQRIWVRSAGQAEPASGPPVRLVGTFQDVTIKVAERTALRQANERIEIATDSGQIGIWDWDVVTGHLFCDDWMHRLHGKEPLKPGDDPLWREHVHRDDKERVVSLLNDALAGVRPYEAEFRIIWPDGGVHHLRGSARVTRNDDGRPIRMVGVNWDVTAQVEARNALRLANERFTLAADSGGIGIFEWDLETNICLCDSWMYRLHDYDMTGEATPLDFWIQHMHPDDIPLVMAALNAAVAGPEPYDTEYRVIWRDGSVHHLRATGRLGRDRDGRALSMIGTNWDVTESRRLTSELAAQHELLSVTLQAIGDGVITTDASRNVTWINPAAERMTGWCATEAVGQPINLIFQTLNADNHEQAENPVANFIAQGNTVGIARNTLLVSREGREMGIENAVAPLRANGGQLLGNVLVFRDVTEQRKLAAETERNAQLQGQLKLKDHFLSHVSHELRSPLTSIYSFASIIEDGLAGETTPEQKDYLHIILKNVSQLQSMIEDLLTVTQSREGKLAVEPQRLDIPEAIVDAINTVQSSAAAKEIALSSETCDHCPHGFADPIRVRQVLIILLDNAVKFTPRGGAISVQASVKDTRLLLVQVTDSGCGIPPDKRMLIFENLYQVTGPTHSDTSLAGRTGLGLGLHIARSLITRQGGNIWVTEAPDHGSVFNFTIPIFTGAAALQETQASEETPRSIRPAAPPKSPSPDIKAA